ncbi:MAG: cytochrome b/b6 domain-containing protein [Pseudohongiellaceae bacterium]|nr:cytochrome b/b6 domain-containing protein [Pseudohongiellaceae bacterium]
MSGKSTIQRYPLAWRLIHWLSAAAIASLAVIGIWMAERAEADLFDSLTDTLYAWHKGIGFCVLALAIVRVLIKVKATAPAYPASLPKKARIAATSLHHLLYVLLFTTPLLGWASVSAYPALGTVGGLSLPAMPGIPVNEELAGQLFEAHELSAFALIALVTGHIGAALVHGLKLKDGIFSRMWFGS